MANRQMMPYLLPFLVYISALFLPLLLPISANLAYLLGFILAGCLLLHYRKSYSLNFRVGIMPFIAGFAIFLLWIMLEGHYPLLSNSRFYPENPFYIIIKLAGSVMVSAAIEELFTRDFLPRYLSNEKWENAPVGKFSFLTFSATALFFGFSHSRWLPALISGILLNALLIREKNITSTIVAHGCANLLLGLYVIYAGSWQFWGAE